MTDSRIRPRRGFAAGGDGLWVGSLIYTGFQGDLMPFYILVSEGGDNKGGRLGIWGGLRPCCTRILFPMGSSSCNSSSNIKHSFPFSFFSFTSLITVISSTYLLYVLETIPLNSSLSSISISPIRSVKFAKIPLHEEPIACTLIFLSSVSQLFSLLSSLSYYIIDGLA